MGTTSQSDAYTRAAGAIPSCAITEEALELQRSRAAKLRQSVTALARHGQVIVFEFDARLDLEALEEMVSVERECCPFFTFGFDEEARRLTVGVKDRGYLRLWKRWPSS